MNPWLFSLILKWFGIAVGAIVGYMFLGRMFQTLDEEWQYSPNIDPVGDVRVWWPVYFIALIFLAVCYLFVLLWRLTIFVIKFVFGRILFPIADWLGKVGARILNKME